VAALEKSSGLRETVEVTPDTAMDLGDGKNEGKNELDKGNLPCEVTGNEEQSLPLADSDEESDTSNLKMAASTVESRVKSKVDYGLIMELSKSLAESVTKLKFGDREKFAGALVYLQKAAAGKENRTPMELEGHLQSYLSCFLKYQSEMHSIQRTMSFPIQLGEVLEN